MSYRCSRAARLALCPRNTIRRRSEEATKGTTFQSQKRNTVTMRALGLSTKEMGCLWKKQFPDPWGPSGGRLQSLGSGCREKSEKGMNLTWPLEWCWLWVSPLLGKGVSRRYPCALLCLWGFYTWGESDGHSSRWALEKECSLVSLSRSPESPVGCGRPADRPEGGLVGHSHVFKRLTVEIQLSEW